MGLDTEGIGRAIGTTQILDVLSQAEHAILVVLVVCHYFIV